MLIRLLWLWLLSALFVAGSTCPPMADLSDASCEPGLFCDELKLSTDGNSFACPSDLTLEGREGDLSSWHALSAATCGAEAIVAIYSDGATTDLGYTQFRCSAPACSVDTSAAYKADLCLATDTCSKAIKDKSKLLCPDENALELYNEADKRWIELTDNRCIGTNLTSADFNGAMEVYRCRELRGCDVNRYFDAKNCDVKEKCINLHSEYFHCNHYKLQASLTNVILWEDVPTVHLPNVECENNRLYIVGSNDIPMYFRCVKDAVCEAVDFTRITENTCEKGDKCPKITRFGTSIGCRQNFKLEHHQNANEPWETATIDCYNKILFDGKTGVQLISGRFRCRSDRGNDMTKYFDKNECGPTKKCLPPISKDTLTYNCEERDHHNTWKLEGKLSGNGLWIGIDSARFEKGVFVMKDSAGIDNPFIPIQFRCIRDATCEVDLGPKFNNGNCPIGDICRKPENNTAETGIVCSANEAIEYQTSINVPWKELTDINCYNQIMEPKRGSVDIDPSTISNIRCRELRTCNFDKYYNDKNCKKQNICIKPDDALQCNTGYKLQFKTLAAKPWEFIDKIICKNQRFVLVNNPNTERDEIPISFQCMLEKKCNIDYYYDALLNDAHHICEKPSELPNLACTSPHMVLRVKHGLDQDWIEVKSIECKNDAFEVLRKSGEIDLEFPLRIQCVKKRLCTEESPLKSDCQNDYLCKEVTFKDKETINCEESTMLSETTSGIKTEAGDLTCDELLGKWDMKNKGTNQIEKVNRGVNIFCKFKDCDFAKFCSNCTKDSNKVNIVRCPESQDTLLRDSTTPDFTPFENVDFVCKLGKWETGAGASLDGTTQIDCIGCDFDHFCTNCTKDTKTRNLMRCPDSKVTMLRNGSTTGYVPYETVGFVCKYGEWVTENGTALDSTTQIDCVDPIESILNRADERISNAEIVTYFLVVFFLLIGVTVLILYVYCRLKTDKWLHTLIFEKAKKNEKKKDVKGASKDRKSPNNSSSAVITPKTNDVENSQGQVSDVPMDSKEKVDGMSVTGLPSNEKMSMENSGAVAP